MNLYVWLAALGSMPPPDSGLNPLKRNLAALVWVTADEYKVSTGSIC